jgi:hypothetical protein
MCPYVLIKFVVWRIKGVTWFLMASHCYFQHARNYSQLVQNDRLGFTVLLILGKSSR